MLIDEVEIIVKAGHGGAGRVSYYPKMGAGPDGGSGGKGGDVYVEVVPDLTILQKYSGQKLWEAEDGEAGGRNTKRGREGKSLTIPVPVGTSLINQESGEKIEFNKVGEIILLARGGKGGRGNFEFRSSRNTTPMYAQPGLPGEEQSFQAILRLIAKFGLIGLPNAGKSSLLNELTASQAKIGAYPFTTLEPNLGVFDGEVIADIPGLIEGASEGRGLGIKFLKHIEKVNLLLHLISSESEDVSLDYKTVTSEMKKFNSNLLEKEELIIVSKSDLVGAQDLKEKVKKLSKLNKQVFTVSIHDWDSLEKLKGVLRKFK